LTWKSKVRADGVRNAREKRSFAYEWVDECPKRFRASSVNALQEAVDGKEAAA